MFHGVRISGVGSYVPDKVLTNFDLEKMVDTSDEWIRTRTGIEERRIADENTPTSLLAANAAENAMADAGLTADDIDLIIVATITPDEPFPNTACHVQRRIGAKKACCFSLEAACSGFLYGFEVGASMIRCGNFKNALVIGAEKMSSLINWEDRKTCVLFGDGAGAVVLSRTEIENDCLIASQLRADGRYTDLLNCPAGGSAKPITAENVASAERYLNMEGQSIFKQAVTSMARSGKAVLKEAGMTIDQIKWLVPHQANDRIISAVGKSLGTNDEQVYVNVNKYGNTSSATIPIALDEIAKGGLVKHGDPVLCVAFGAGLTWGATLLRW